MISPRLNVKACISILFFFMIALGNTAHAQQVDTITPRKILYKGDSVVVYPEYQSHEFWQSILDVGLYRTESYSPYPFEHQFPIDGKWVQFYDEDTTLPAKIFAVRNGRLHGDWVIIDLDGQVLERSEYREGKFDGISAQYYSNGKPKLEHVYHSNTLQGKQTEWFETGGIKRSGYFVDGQRDSLWTYYYPNGSIKGTIHCFRGELEGEASAFYPNGQTRVRLLYHRGWIVNGTYTFYDSVGNRAAEGVLRDGLRRDRWTYWYPNGQIARQGNYKVFSKTVCAGGDSELFYYSIRTGEWRYFYDDGRLMARGKYSVTSRPSDLGNVSGTINIAGREEEWVYQDENGKRCTYENLPACSMLEEPEYLEPVYLSMDEEYLDREDE